MALSLTGAHEVAEAVLACVCAALEETAATVAGQPGCPCRACVVPGQPAWDECGNDACGDGGGQLTVHIARVFPSRTFPAEDRGGQEAVRGLRGCAPPPTTAMELVVTLLRCAPTLDEQGCPPTCEELQASARILHTDMVTIYSALECCIAGTAPTRRGRRYVLGGQRVLGPQGGCVGVEQRAIVALPPVCCPEGEES
jgi:hypothetical protein